MERYKGKQPSNSNVPSYCQGMNGFECGSKSKAKGQLQCMDMKTRSLTVTNIKASSPYHDKS